MAASSRKQKRISCDLVSAEFEEKLYFAITHNDAKGLRCLIEDGAEVDMIFYGADPTTKSLWSALHICCEKGHYDCAKVLLEAGALPDIRDKWGHTPLMYAVMAEWTEIVELLLDHGCRIDHREQAGLTAVHQAVNCSDNQCLGLLIQYGADLDIGDAMGRTPLWQAMAKDGNIEKIRLLILSGCDLNLADAKKQLTPIQAAIMYAQDDRMKYVKLLIECGCDVGMVSPEGQTPLMTAIARGWRDGDCLDPTDAEIFEYLLQIGCPMDEVTAGDYRFRRTGTVLKFAAERGTLSLMEKLLENGAAVDKPGENSLHFSSLDNQNKVTPLMAAVMNKKPECVQLLLDYGSDVKSHGRIRMDSVETVMTPFRYALLKGDREICRQLILAGVDVNEEIAQLSNEELNEFLQHEDFLTWLNTITVGVLSLSSLCRSSIRKALSCGISRKVASLPLPDRLKSYLLMQDVPGIKS